MKLTSEVDRATLDRIASPEILRLVHVDEFGTGGQVRVIEHLRGGHLHGRWLGHIAVHIGKCELHGLDLQMLGRCAIHRMARQIESVQYAQRNQRCDALPVGRDLVQGIASVVAGNGRNPFRAVCCQIRQRQAAALGLREGDQRLGNFARVERLALCGPDGAQRTGCGGKLEQLTHLRRAAQGKKLSANPGCDCSSGTAAAHFCCTTTGTR